MVWNGQMQGGGRALLSARQIGAVEIAWLCHLRLRARPEHLTLYHVSDSRTTPFNASISIEKHAYYVLFLTRAPLFDYLA